MLPSAVPSTRVTLLASILAMAACLGAEAQAPSAAADPIMGLYQGAWTITDARAKVTAQIRALGENQYDGFLEMERNREPLGVLVLQSDGPARDGAVRLVGKSTTAGARGELLPAVSFTGEIRSGRLTGSLQGDLGDGTVLAERSTKSPESVGTGPPPGAIVLFDGKDTSRWENFTWNITPEGAMQVTRGNIRTKDRLESFRLHIEFRTPFMPAARGQARGNSGVYLQRKFEVQVLDSFGLFPLQINDCSSLYGVQVTSQNVCLPPLEWQSYDITFRAADPAAKLGPVITVYHNGVRVVDAARVPWELADKGTTAGDGSGEGGFLMLQDHGNPVEFRNIWALPLAK